eukprot:scaffold273286_cov31-Tisochrysis_lutea.AAC.1
MASVKVHGWQLGRFWSEGGTRRGTQLESGAWANTCWVDDIMLEKSAVASMLLWGHAQMLCVLMSGMGNQMQR